MGKVSLYTSESGRSGYSRGLEHESHLNRKTKGQPLADHARLSHPGKDLGITNFSMQITAQYKSALPRLISEGIQVERMVQRQKIEPGKVEVLNSKLNFNQARPMRTIITDRLLG